MIDTLKFRLDDYDISSQSKLSIQPSIYNHSTNEMSGNFLLYQDRDHTIEGSKAFYNCDNFNLTLSVKKGAGSMCFVQMSLPKAYNGNNFHSVGRQGSKATLKKIEQELKEVGVRCNILQSHLSRVDTFKNIETEENFSSYYRIFSELKVPRKKSRDYGTAFLYYNDYEEICIYDKILEMQSKNISTKDYPKNVIRFENRLLKARKIKDSLGMSKVIELFSIDGYEHVREKFKHNMEKNIFKYTSTEININSTKKIEQDLLYFMSMYKENWLDRYLKTMGITTLNNDFGREALRKALENVMPDDINKNTRKSKLDRLTRKINEAETDLLMMSNSQVQDKTIVNLYDELKTKVLAVA